MNLKEAFRYQNKLQSFMDEAQAILSREENITKVEKTYLRRKVCSAKRNGCSPRSAARRTPCRSTWTARSA